MWTWLLSYASYYNVQISGFVDPQHAVFELLVSWSAFHFKMAARFRIPRLYKDVGGTRVFECVVGGYTVSETLRTEARLLQGANNYDLPTLISPRAGNAGG
jgi:hypothetical protein